MPDGVSVNVTVVQDPCSDKSDYGICYVNYPWVYFTKSVKDQWGDDWDDAPYQHNAGRPYGYPDRNDAYPDTFAIAVASKLQPPEDTGYNVSVEAINEGDIPWLSTPRWIDEEVQLHAGDSYEEVVSAINDLGGTVFVPRDK